MTLAFIASLSLAYAGMLALCLGMERHFKQVFGRPPVAHWRAGLRAAGWSLLATSLYAAALAWGAGMGAVGWFGLISLSGFGLLLLLPWAPRLALWLPAGGAVAWGLVFAVG